MHISGGHGAKANAQTAGRAGGVGADDEGEKHKRREAYPPMGATKGGGHGGQHHQQGAASGKNGRQGMHEFERARMALGEG